MEWYFCISNIFHRGDQSTYGLLRLGQKYSIHLKPVKQRIGLQSKLGQLVQQEKKTHKLDA